MYNVFNKKSIKFNLICLRIKLNLIDEKNYGFNRSILLRGALREEATILDKK